MPRIKITDNFVEKQFPNLRKYENELNYRKKFEDYFIVPSILSEDKENLIIKFEKINDPFLNSELTNWGINDINRLFYHLPNEEGGANEFERVAFVKAIMKDIPPFVLNSVTGGKGFLIHGDFRPPNIFIRNNKFGLIDFEHSGYGYKERDLAYFYMELVYFNPTLSGDLLKRARKSDNYNRFLFYCLFYTLSSMQNPLSYKEGLESVLIEVSNEIKRVS